MNTQVNIIDLECTCWIDEPQPKGQVQEIIEIGICQLDLKDLIIRKNRSIFVIPDSSEISDSCTKLTSITPEMIDADGVSFEDAIGIMRDDYNIGYSFWASYGNFDRDMFSRQCRRLYIDYPLCPQHINVKAVIRSAYPQVRGLESALKITKLDFEGRPHLGRDDALNIARLYRTILRRITKEV